MITKDALYSSPATSWFLFHSPTLFHPFCFLTVPSISVTLSFSIDTQCLSSSLLPVRCDCKPCCSYNAQQVNTHRSGCISDVTYISGSFAWVGQVCVCVCVYSLRQWGRGIDSISQRFPVILYRAKKARHPLHRGAYCFSQKNTSTVDIHIRSGANEITALCCDGSRRVLWEGANIANR